MGTDKYLWPSDEDKTLPVGAPVYVNYGNASADEKKEVCQRLEGMRGTIIEKFSTPDGEKCYALNMIHGYEHDVRRDFCVACPVFGVVDKDFTVFKFWDFDQKELRSINLRGQPEDVKALLREPLSANDDIEGRAWFREVNFAHNYNRAKF